MATNMNLAVEAGQRARSLRPWWMMITLALATAVFAQAVFAGLMLSGSEWARAAHATTAFALILSALAAGIAAIVTLRRIPHGANLGWTLLALGVAISVQTAVGKAATGGANFMWLHVPLGVALAGFAMQALNAARRLGAD